MGSRTLAARLFFLTALWAVFATVIVAWVIAQSFRDSAQENLSQRLTANLYNIMGSVVPDESGRFETSPDLRDSRYRLFRSGYYWSVTNVSDTSKRIASQSLGGDTIAVESGRRFDSDFQRNFRTTDAAGNELIGIEAQAFLGEGDALFSFKITGNLSEVDSQTNEFITRLLIVLALFALGFILVTYFIVRLGLAPLRDATAVLADIRDGKADKLEGEFPSEIQPLIDETNTLITSNKAVIERARTQVGNLAHSLKTPLAVLKNEAVQADPKLRRIIDDQTGSMQAQIQAYLDRAQIAARAGTVTSRTDILPALERLTRVMAKLNPDLSIELAANEKGKFAGEQQDLEEMVGNLMENACKFAKDTIQVNVVVSGPEVSIMVEDDGVGMGDAETEKALQRGTRLDETKPGSGLGLSIVKDIAGEYGGKLIMGRSKLGGLEARLVLPAVQSSKKKQ